MKSIKEKIKAKFKKIGLDENGKELMDSTPNRIALGLGQAKQEPLHLMVKRMIRENANAIAMEQGSETFEEANDFDIDDDINIETVYERNFDTQVPDYVMKKHIEDLNNRYQEANQKYQELKAKQGVEDESTNKNVTEKGN
jgi:hypothetical protein